MLRHYERRHRRHVDLRMVSSGSHLLHTAALLTAELHTVKYWRPCFHKNYTNWTSPSLKTRWGSAAIARPLFGESNSQMHKQGVHKIWAYWKDVIWADKLSSFTMLPISVWVYIWRTWNLECLVATVKHDMGRFCDCLGSNIMLCWSHYYLSLPDYYKEVCEQIG
jgi:hypothetical protein